VLCWGFTRRGPLEKAVGDALRAWCRVVGTP
jgi:hypothetical protein